LAGKAKMQSTIQIKWVPLPEERSSQWHHAIEVIAQIMRDEFNRMGQPSFPYRLAWEDPATGRTHQGAPLFRSPDEATETKAALESMFPSWRVWVEPVK
jgi:hypothetical protein